MYRPDGMMLDDAVNVDVEQIEGALYTISGEANVVEQLHSYFTGKGYEDCSHDPISDSVTDICNEHSFTINTALARELLYQQGVSYVYFDLLLADIERSGQSRGYDQRPALAR